MYFNSMTCNKPVDFQRTFAMNINFIYYAYNLLYIRCTNYIISISKKGMQSDSTTICDIQQQLNDIEVCHIYIINISEDNAYSS